MKFIARQNDVGGKFLLEDNWTTFQKARLNCSRSGDYPFYFDELQDTHYDQHRALIYAVFTTPESVYPLSFTLQNYLSEAYASKFAQIPHLK